MPDSHLKYEENSSKNMIILVVGCFFLIVSDQIWLYITYKDHKKVIKNIQCNKTFLNKDEIDYYYNNKDVKIDENLEKEKRCKPTIRQNSFILVNILLLIHFVMLIQHKPTTFEAFVHGFLLHSIINFYNYAYIYDYDIIHAIKEIIYGTLVITITVYLINLFTNKK